MPRDLKLAAVERPDLPSLVRQRILDGFGREFSGRLPSERALCRELGVSRPTLRTALNRLESDGLLQRRGGRGERHLASKPRKRKPTALVARLLQDGSSACFLGEHLQTTAFLSEVMHGLGGRLALENVRSCFSAQPSMALDRLIASARADLWILYRSTRAMQEWFARKGVPVIVLGSAWNGTSLHAVDVDHAAACRHAAGMLIARGHRRLAVFHPEKPPRGDAVGLAAFAEAAKLHKPDAVSIRTVSHDGTSKHLCMQADRLLRVPQPPDGWLVFGAHHFLTICTHLLAQGIRPGRQVSVLSRDYDPLFASLVPSPAHYRRDLHRMHHQLARLIRRLIQGGSAGPATLTVETVFRDGETLRAQRLVGHGK